MGIDQQLSALPSLSWEDEPDGDPIIAELDAYRAEYAARFNYDLDRIAEDIKAQEALNPAFRKRRASSDLGKNKEKL